MKIRTLKLLPLLLALFLVSGCAAGPAETSKQDAALKRQVGYYEDQAQSYRESQNERMAVYFDERAGETREKRLDAPSGMVEFLVDILFEALW